MGGFSAVGYYFGRSLHKALQTPVGLVHTSFSGTPAEAWTSRETIEADPAFKAIYDRRDQNVQDYRKHIETEHYGPPLPLNARQRIYAWIDADVPYYGTYAHTGQNHDLTGYRDRWYVGTESDWFRKEFLPTFQRRCAGCHERTVDCTQPYATDSITARVTSKAWSDQRQRSRLSKHAQGVATRGLISRCPPRRCAIGFERT